MSLTHTVINPAAIRITWNISEEDTSSAQNLTQLLLTVLTPQRHIAWIEIDPEKRDYTLDFLFPYTMYSVCVSVIDQEDVILANSCDTVMIDPIKLSGNGNNTAIPGYPFLGGGNPYGDFNPMSIITKIKKFYEMIIIGLAGVAFSFMVSFVVTLTILLKRRCRERSYAVEEVTQMSDLTAEKVNSQVKTPRNGQKPQSEIF